MISDHLSVGNRNNASLKLFFCPTCSQNLELKSKQNFEQHLNLCSQSQILTCLSTDDMDDKWMDVEAVGKSDKLDNSSKIKHTDMSKHFTIQRGAGGKIQIVECVHCRMRFAIRGGEYSGFVYHLGKRHNISCKDLNSPHSLSTEDSELTQEQARSVTNDDIININGAAEELEEINCHLCEFSLLDTDPSHPANNGRHRMRQHYSIIHNIRHMRLCEKRGCNFRSASYKLNRKHRREEAGHSQCEVCGVQILTERLEIHKKQVHSDLTFDCEYCNRPYGNAGHLK